MTDLDKLLDDAEDLGTPESWRPAPGDKLAGTLIRYDRMEGAYGPCWTAVVRVETPARGPHLVAAWLSHKVLAERFRTLRPKPGERIGIKRVADRETPKGQRYAVYVVVVDRPDFGQAVPDWDAEPSEPVDDAPAASGPRPTPDDVPF